MAGGAEREREEYFDRHVGDGRGVSNFFSRTAHADIMA